MSLMFFFFFFYRPATTEIYTSLHTLSLHDVRPILVLGAYVLIKGDPYSLCSAAADGLRRIHETLGMLVFVVGVLQLLWRLIDSTPVKQPMPRWMTQAAKRSEEHTSELQSLMRITYAVFCLKKKKKNKSTQHH